MTAMLLGGFAATVRSQDAVIQWNTAALNAIRTASTPPPPASRNLAILHAAMFDAVNGIDPGFEHYLVRPAAPLGAYAPAAATSAAHDVMVALYAAQSATFDALNNAILAGIPDGQRKTDGIAWGRSVAAQVLATRANDGSANTAPYPGSNVPGMWRPHRSFGGVVRPALLPLWGQVTPFCLNSGSQLRPPPPPPLPSFQYGMEVMITQWLGGQDDFFRPPDATEMALFWGYGPGTATPPGHWNQITTAVARTDRRSLLDHARLYALVNIAMADACIVSWDCKYVFGLWRPITAINLADQDGNPMTAPDVNWLPLLDTPPFPEYTSGHSTFSAAAAVVLAHFYGTDDVAFTVGSDDLPNVTRSFARFSDAALESGWSRIFGGIHFYSANVLGLGTGAQTADQVNARMLLPSTDH